MSMTTLTELQKEARESQDFIRGTGAYPESFYKFLDSLTRKAFIAGIEAARDAIEAIPSENTKVANEEAAAWANGHNDGVFYAREKLHTLLTSLTD